MSRPRIPQSLAAREFEARLTPSHQAKTLATRLPRAEMLAVEEAAQAAGQTCSQWLREAAIAHLKRPVRSRKSIPDPTLLTELLGLRQLTVNLFAAVAGSFQSFNLIGDLTVFQNVELPLTYRVGMASSERKRRVEAALERVHMTHRLRHFPAQLSARVRSGGLAANWRSAMGILGKSFAMGSRRLPIAQWKKRGGNVSRYRQSVIG